MNLIVNIFILIIINAFPSTNSIKTQDLAKSIGYQGKWFPKQYLEPEPNSSKTKDLNVFINALGRVLLYFGAERRLNTTHHYTVIGAYFCKIILKVALRDDGSRVDETTRKKLKRLIWTSDVIISHWVYHHRTSGWSDESYRVSVLLKDDAVAVNMIRKFGRTKLEYYLREKTNYNSFGHDFDTLTLPKEKYIELHEDENYFMATSDTNICLSRIAYSAEPLGCSRKVQPCREDYFCTMLLYSSPSVAYGLSNKLQNLVLRRLTRRCYALTRSWDNHLMAAGCAAMYREAVYVARRGFFARDLFLEHVSLCGMLGFEELHRISWHRKVASWVSKVGCVHENENLQINRTRLRIKKSGDNEIKKTEHRDELENTLSKKCHLHVMSMTLPVLAQAVRYNLHRNEDLRQNIRIR